MELANSTADGPELDRLRSEARAILDALVVEPLTRDELGRRLAHQPERLALALIELQLRGRLVEDRVFVT